MEYLHRLVERNLIDRSAVDVAQAERDPATLGIFGANRAQNQPAPQVGGRASAAGQGQPAPQVGGGGASAAQSQPTSQFSGSVSAAAAAQAGQSTASWEWDETYRGYRYWDGQKWVWQQ